MNLPLFSIPYEGVDWEKVFRIGQGTAQDIILQDLLRAQGRYLNGWKTWRGDWRKRISEMRQMGIPILDRPDPSTKNQNEYSLDKNFIREYYFQKLGGAG